MQNKSIYILSVYRSSIYKVYLKYKFKCYIYACEMR